MKLFIFLVAMAGSFIVSLYQLDPPMLVLFYWGAFLLGRIFPLFDNKDN